MTRKPSIWMAWGVVLLVAVIATVISYLWFDQQRQSALRVTADLRITQNLSQQIQQLQHRRTVVRGEQIEETELARRIETAMQTAKVELTQLIRIAPQSPRRLGNTDYRELSTQITLRQLTLVQLVDFLHALMRSDHELQIARIQFSAPREDAATDTWRAEVELKYLLYDPIPPAHAATGGPQ